MTELSRKSDKIERRNKKRPELHLLLSVRQKTAGASNAGHSLLYTESSWISTRACKIFQRKCWNPSETYWGFETKSALPWAYWASWMFAPILGSGSADLIGNDRFVLTFQKFYQIQDFNGKRYRFFDGLWQKYAEKNWKQKYGIEKDWNCTYCFIAKTQ